MSIEYRKENFIAVHTCLEEVKIDGEAALRVYKADKQEEFDTNTMALLKNSDFHNGTIETDMRSRLLPDAPDFARGFIGIVFRTKADTSEFESFYVRPTNGRRCDDPQRRSHGCQYFSFPGYTFAYFREFGITAYEAPTDTDLDEWIHLKAEIHDDQGQFYVNDQLVLSVHDLKHGADAHGALGFYVDTGTDAYFKNLHVIYDD